MIKNIIKLNKFNKQLVKNENLSYKKALSIYEALHKEAVSLNIINSKNILDGIETDLRIARALNPRRNTSKISE